MCPKCNGKEFYFYTQNQMRGIGTGIRQISRKRKFCKKCDLVMGRQVKSREEEFRRKIKIILPEFIWIVFIPLTVLILIGLFNLFDI